MEIKQLFLDLSRQRRYWAGLVLLGIALELAALYYQYVLDEWPCVLCIHVRIWVAAFIVLGLVALALNASTSARRLCHGISIGIMLGLLEVSYQLLAIERGWVFGDCDMNLGMPSWFALDKWFPAIFEVQTSCGYTPLIFLNVSMAEVLLVLSVLLVIVTGSMFAASWISRQ